MLTILYPLGKIDINTFFGSTGGIVSPSNAESKDKVVLVFNSTSLLGNRF